MQLQSILYETSECSKSVIQFQIKKTDTHFTYNTIRIVTNKDAYFFMTY